MSDLTREEREALCPLTLAPCVPKCEGDMLRLCWMDAIERNPEALDRFKQAAYERGAAEVRARVEALLDDLPTLTEGVDRVGTAWWPVPQQDAYSLALDEAATVIRAALDADPSPSADDEGVAR